MCCDCDRWKKENRKINLCYNHKINERKKSREKYLEKNKGDLEDKELYNQKQLTYLN